MSPSGRCMAFFVLASLLAQPVFGQDSSDLPVSDDGTAGQVTIENKFLTVDPPPVKRIVMFNSGLSQVVHAGSVDGNNRVELKFTGHDIDDVLKSLVFEDRAGGIIRSVEYKPAPDTQDIAAQKLGPPMTMAQTLQKYRGEKVMVATGEQEFEGSIVSVENRQDGPDFRETLTLVNEDGFVSLSLIDIKRIKFDDQDLREEFQLAMVGLTKSRAADLKTIGLLFEGEGNREVRFSYNVDAPIWRMTYRLDLADAESTLQGWAHIDNVTGVDWNEIELDLRSGRPQSFHVDLFAPVLAERPSLGLDIFDIPADQTLVPQWFGFNPPSRFSLETEIGLGGGGRGGGFGGGGFGGSGGGFGGGSPFGGGQPQEDLQINTAIDPSAIVGRSTKMVQFKLKEPVSLQAGRSAMVPVISAEVPVELFSMLDVYEKDVSAHFFALVKNDSGFPLIPGPVALYRQGDFVGDAVMARMEQGSQAGFIYGSDISVTLREDADRLSKVVSSVGWKDEQIELLVTVTSRSTYIVTNEDSLPRQILLKVPNIATDVEPKPDLVDGRTLQYRFECKSNSTVRHTVQQTTKQSRLLDIEIVTQNDFDSWTKEGASIDEDLAGKLKEIFQLKSDIAVLRLALAKAESRSNEIRKEQTRITDIIKVLEPDSAATQSYLERLAETEVQLAEARDELELAAARVLEAETKLKELY